MESTIHYRPNPRYHADGINVYFGSSQDSRLVYDGTNNEWTVQSKDSGGTQTDRLKVASGGDVTTVELYNDDPGATGVRLDSHHDSASPADSDVLLDQRVYGEDDGGTKTQYGGLTWVIKDATGGSEDGGVELRLVKAGTLTKLLDYTTGAFAFQEATAISVSAGNLSLDAASGSAIRLNDAQADVDVIIESNTGDNLFDADAGLGAIGINESASGLNTLRIGGSFTGSGAVWGTYLAQTLTPAGTNNDVYHLYINPGSQGISGQTHPLIASAVFSEPAITLNSSTVNEAATLHIVNAPTEGGENYALHVKAGETRLGGNLKVGATTVRGTTEASLGLYLFNGTVPAGTLANGVTLYSKDVSSSAELHVMDEAGNDTLLSSHPADLLDTVDAAHPYPWAYDARNEFLGKHIQVDMAALVAAVEAISGKRFLHVRDIPKILWDGDDPVPAWLASRGVRKATGPTE